MEHISGYMKKRTTVRLPSDLLSRAKRKAAAEGRTLTSLIADGLRMAIADNRKSVPAKRMPPVSKAAGGLLEGIDVADARAMQEIDDIESVQRLTRIQGCCLNASMF
jgi:hypothetical protein